MSRPGRCRVLSIATAVAAVLVAPAAAHAASYTINSGDGGCGPGDLACGGFAEAAAIAAAGDVFTAAPGIYPGATFSVPNVTINGASGVLVNTTLTFAGGAGPPSTVSKVAVVAAAGPGIVVTGASGLQLVDAVAVSQNDHAIFISAGAANKIVRTNAATGGAQTSAIRVQSDAGTPAKSLTVESTLAIGGGSAIGAFTTSAPVLPGAAGDITLVLRHVTAAGATNGIVLNATAGSNLLNNGAGNITATVTDSLALNSSANSATGPFPNTAALNTTRSLTGAEDPNAIYAAAAAKNFRLKPGSIAIGQGSVVPGESATDIDGEDRSAVPTDLGGDEFNNAAPVAKIAVKTNTPRATQNVEFDGSGSTDREAAYGGGIVQYQWTFSDGKTETTSGPTVGHVFPKEGDAGAQLVVVDRQGAVSAPATVDLKLVDGTPPTIGIVKPKANQKIKRFTTKTRTIDGKKRTTRTRTKIVFGGLSRDANGVSQIVLTLEKLGTSSTSTQCNWFNPKKGVVRKSCKKPTLFAARLVKDSKTGEWSYTMKRNLNIGTYRLSAVGIDNAGAFGNAGGSKLGIVRFRIV